MPWQRAVLQGFAFFLSSADEAEGPFAKELSAFRPAGFIQVSLFAVVIEVAFAQLAELFIGGAVMFPIDQPRCLRVALYAVWLSLPHIPPSTYRLTQAHLLLTKRLTQELVRESALLEAKRDFLLGQHFDSVLLVAFTRRRRHGEFLGATH